MGATRISCSDASRSESDPKIAAAPPLSEWPHKMVRYLRVSEGHYEAAKIFRFLGGAVALPIMARAQPAIPVIGYLGAELPTRFASRLEAFRRGLRSTGFDEGRNVMIEYRWAEGRNDRLPTLAEELVSRQVSVITAPGSVASALAAKAATRNYFDRFRNRCRSGCCRIGRRSEPAGRKLRA